uniref:Uncharacterized protein n=1 Tax=Globodera rostochiensis TaxID=31243 RepID=A0A914H3P6_GLORO
MFKKQIRRVCGPQRRQSERRALERGGVQIVEHRAANVAFLRLLQPIQRHGALLLDFGRLRVNVEHRVRKQFND